MAKLKGSIIEETASELDEEDAKYMFENGNDYNYSVNND